MLFSWVKEPHQGETSRTQVDQSLPTTGTQHNHWRGTAPDHHHFTSHCPPRTELCHNSFTAPNPNPILCSKKQQRTTQETNATSQNSSIPSQTSSIPLQLLASAQTVCKACHATNQSPLHKLGPCTASQCQGHRKGCPSAFLINNISDIHAAMGNSGAVQLLGWF